MKTCKTHPYIDDYLGKIISGEIRSDKEIKQATELIYKKLDNPDVFIDSEKIDKAVELIERYFDMKLVDWELNVIALIHCYYLSDDSVVFDELLIVMGRGNGKNGFISGLSWYLTTHYHGIKGYNVDIIANNEDQAKTSFNDVYEVLENAWEKLKNFFYKSKTEIKNTRTNSYIKYNTSNAKTKDGKRSACLIFDEVHEYENFDSIKVFTSGFGKRKHSRTFYITTNGYVREGVLDELLNTADMVLNGEVESSGMLPLIYKLDDEKEADDPKNWVKANPSFPYFPELRKQIEKDYKAMQYQSHKRQDFFTKRMNMPRGDTEFIIVDYEIIKLTNKPLINLHGRECVVGIDYASINDMASTDLHFRENDNRYDINHSWLCLGSADLPRIRMDWSKWVDDGLLTTVDSTQILPSHICRYIEQQKEFYTIVGVALDGFKYTLMAEKLAEIGFSRELGNVWIVTQNDIKRTAPVIEYCFNNNLFHWGDHSLLRWGTNNTKKIISKTDNSYYYGKIEGKSRKTDPFMSLVASMVIEDRLSAGYEEPEFNVY